MSEIEEFPLYDRLLNKYRQVKYKSYNMMMITSAISGMLRQLDEKSCLEIGEVIYALIYHHERVKRISFNKVAFNGTIRPHKIGVQFEMSRLPSVLQQIIILFYHELIDGTCPEMIDSTEEA